MAAEFPQEFLDSLASMVRAGIDFPDDKIEAFTARFERGDGEVSFHFRLKSKYLPDNAVAYALLNETLADDLSMRKWLMAFISNSAIESLDTLIGGKILDRDLRVGEL